MVAGLSAVRVQPVQHLQCDPSPVHAIQGAAIETSLPGTHVKTLKYLSIVFFSLVSFSFANLFSLVLYIRVVVVISSPKLCLYLWLSNAYACMRGY